MIFAVLIGLTIYFLGFGCNTLPVPYFQIYTWTWPVFIVAALIIMLFAFIKRLHDIDKNDTFAFIGLIPVLGLLFMLYLLFLKGTIGPNKYGPDPLIKDESSVVT